MLTFERDCSRSCLQSELQLEIQGSGAAKRLSYFPDRRTRQRLDIKQSKNSRDTAEKICEIDMLIKLEMLVCCSRMREILKFSLRIEIFHVLPAYSNKDVPQASEHREQTDWRFGCQQHEYNIFCSDRSCFYWPFPLNTQRTKEPIIFAIIVFSYWKKQDLISKCKTFSHKVLLILSNISVIWNTFQNQNILSTPDILGIIFVSLIFFFYKRR